MIKNDRQREAGRTRLDGVVADGLGEAQHFMSLNGYVEQFIEKLGYEPYPGTLNVDLEDQQIAFERLTRIDIDEWEADGTTYGAASCCAVTLATDDGRTYEQAHVLVPERTRHETTTLEIIAPDQLRDALDLDTGMDVIIYVYK